MVPLVVHHQDPEDAGVLIRQRDQRPIRPPSRLHLLNPLTGAIGVLMRPLQHGPRAMDKELAEIGITAFTNAQELGLPS